MGDARLCQLPSSFPRQENSQRSQIGNGQHTQGTLGDQPQHRILAAIEICVDKQNNSRVQAKNGTDSPLSLELTFGL